MKISFLFGAGADVSNKIKLPMGPEFTYKSLFGNNEKLRDALDGFYKNISEIDYSCKYQKFPLLNSQSVLFKSIMNRVFEDDNKKDYKKLYDKFTEILDKKFDQGELERVFPGIDLDIDFKGGVEQYFSTICEPKKYGNIRFWKLINFYWNCYFMILTPILRELYDELPQEDDKFYDKVLNDLNLVEDIFGAKYMDFYKEQFPYYALIKEIFSDYEVESCITTNYTPFVKCSHGNTIYLSGRLNQFECPQEMRLIGIEQVEKIKKDKIVFPYIMTQSPIKPIIAPEQIDQYLEFKKCLDNTDVLIIIGYSLCKNDNHILSFLRDFVMKENKYIIYYQHEKDDSKKTKVDERLYFSSDMRHRYIEINSFFETDKEEERAYEAIKKKLDKMNDEGYSR